MSCVRRFFHSLSSNHLQVAKRFLSCPLHVHCTLSVISCHVLSGHATLLPHSSHSYPLPTCANVEQTGKGYLVFSDVMTNKMWKWEVRRAANAWRGVSKYTSFVRLRACLIYAPHANQSSIHCRSEVRICQPWMALGILQNR